MGRCEICDDPTVDGRLCGACYLFRFGHRYGSTTAMAELQVTEDELNYLCLGGEYVRYKELGELGEFDRRFGPDIRERIPFYRASDRQSPGDE